jgi:myosin-5
MISKPTFIVVHTAKDVEYSITEFREKNKDELSSLTHKMSSLSKDELMAKLFRILPPGEEKKDKSLSKKLRY